VTRIKHLSYSSINLYQMCPRAWRYRYIDRVPSPPVGALLFGSAFHGAIESMLIQKHTADSMGDPEAHFLEAWRETLEEERNADPAWKTEEEPAELLDLGIRMLGVPAIIDTIQALDLAEVDGAPAIELRMETKIPGLPVPLVGYIDAIAADGVPIDFKTSGRKWWADKANNDQQPSFYLAALSQAGWDRNPAMAFRYYIFTKTKNPVAQIIETGRTPLQLFKLFEQVLDIWKAIHAEVFPCITTTWKCSEKFCDYWPLCMGAA